MVTLLVAVLTWSGYWVITNNVFFFNPAIGAASQLYSMPVPSPDKWGGFPVSKGMRGVNKVAPTPYDETIQLHGPQSRAALRWAEGAK